MNNLFPPDDPSVLRQLEKEFLSVNFASDDEDKENETPVAPQRKEKAKEQRKTLTTLTEQKPKRKQTKKVKRGLLCKHADGNFPPHWVYRLIVS